MLRELVATFATIWSCSSTYLKGIDATMSGNETCVSIPITAEFGANCYCTKHFNIIPLYILRLLTWSLPLEVLSLNFTGPHITLTNPLTKCVVKQPSDSSILKLQRKRSHWITKYVLYIYIYLFIYICIYTLTYLLNSAESFLRS